MLSGHIFFYFLRWRLWFGGTLDTSKGAGPDLIPPSFLKRLKYPLSKILTKLFNKSLQVGTFPNQLKESHLVPIFKSGEKANIINYRGISKLSKIHNLFESMVFNKLNPFISPTIHPSQHGFESGKSTLTNLATHTTFLRLNMAKGHQIDTIYTDFSKAFDVVDHALLLFKLERYGIRGKLLEWIKSFLRNRTQRIKFQSILSEPINVKSGVPQGGVLSPLLFKTFNNDIALILLHCIISSFADDLKISIIIKSLLDVTTLQNALTALSIWCRNNGMLLNEKKCNVITFARSNNIIEGEYVINDTPLLRVSQIRDLGVILDSKLTMKKQIDKIVSSGRSILGFVKRRAKEFESPYLTKKFFTTFVLPVVEYVSPIWAPYRQVDCNRIESIQKQFLIFALRHLGFQGPQLPPYESRLLLIDMTPLVSRRKLASALLAFDLLQDNIKVPELRSRFIVNSNQHSTRSRRYIREELHHTDFAFFDVISTAIRNFNTYASFFDPAISKKSFKDKILTKMKTLHEVT